MNSFWTFFVTMLGALDLMFGHSLALADIDPHEFARCSTATDCILHVSQHCGVPHIALNHQKEKAYLEAMSPKFERLRNLDCAPPEAIVAPCLERISKNIGCSDGLCQLPIGEKSGLQEQQLQIKSYCADVYEKECTRLGGQWGGLTPGRGRITECNLPTKDGDKPCDASQQCESVCIMFDNVGGHQNSGPEGKRGRCHGYRQYRGCGLIVSSPRGDNSTICVD